ncbi:MAG TPA: O-antigen ligase family protein [Xanthobacteraceae bacterium]|nr:O-antigen ligase family protein [Xanthobacteraceae bacterium]
MFTHLKELIVVLAIAGPVFLLAKPVALRFSLESDFVRRRNLWLLLTIIGFLSPSFWWYALVATPMILWARRKDSNPIALYLFLLHVVPPVSVNIPVIVINRLFDIDNYRLLSFCILIPIAWGLRHSRNRDRNVGFRAMDRWLIAYGAVQVALFVPPDLPHQVILHDSLTNALRRLFLFIVDVYVLYFSVSRSCANKRAIVDAEASFCVSCVVMALVGFFETSRHWLLYSGLALSWNRHDLTFVLAYLLRGASLRAQASAGHAIALAYLLAIALGFWLYLRSRETFKPAKLSVAAVLLLGLLATYSRGPWLGAALIYMAFIALRRRVFSRSLLYGTILAFMFAAVMLSPLGNTVINALPITSWRSGADFIYRQRLAERTYELVRAHPWFGDQLAMLKMEDLRQGQGIIDLVNTYAGIALLNGLVGLTLFLGFIFTGLYRAFRAARIAIPIDPDLGLLGISLVACILGTLFIIADTSLILGIQKLFYVLAGLAAAYANLSRPSDTPVVSHPIITPSRVSH